MNHPNWERNASNRASPRSLEDDLREEIQLHLHERAAELRAAGATPEEAWRRAVEAFGDPDKTIADAVRERERGAKTTGRGGLMGVWEGWKQDVRFGLRSLVRAPGFAVVVIATLALGVGTSTAMFSVVDGILLRPLPYPEAERLVLTGLTHVGANPSYTSLPEFIDLRDGATSFETVAGVQRSSLVIGGEGDPVRVSIGAVTEGFFGLFGVRMSAGRGFTQEEYHAIDGQVLIISHGLWMRRWNGDPSVIGQPLRVDEDASGSFRILTVVGILPENFTPPEALRTAEGAEAWVPLSAGTEAYAGNRTSRTMFLVAKLRSGIDLPTARRDLEMVSGNLLSAYPGIYVRPGGNNGVGVQSLMEATVSGNRTMLLILLASAAFLLLIGCANAANLILARAIERRRELALRSALGAGRVRLVGQLLTESLVTASVAGALGIIIAWSTLKAVRTFGPDSLPRLESLSLDLNALSFALLATLVTGLLFGLAPALLGSVRGEPGPAPGRGGSNRATHRLRNALVVGETALAMMLLTGAGLMLNSYFEVAQVDPGFTAEDVSYTSVSLSDAYDTAEERIVFFASLAEEVRSIPGVASAGLIADPPVGFTMWAPAVLLPDAPEGPVTSVPAHLVDEGFLPTLGIQILQGRGLAASDNAEAAPVTVINESMAHQFWPDSDPVGQRFRMNSSGPWVTVVGVANDVLQDAITGSPEPRHYVPYAQNLWFPHTNVVIKSQPGAQVTPAAVRQAIHRVDSTLPFEGVTTMSQRISASLQMRTFNTALLGAFALIALTLAAGGLYGTVRYVVERRTHEVGVRLALGGEPGHVLSLMVRHGIALASGGIMLGLVGAGLTSRALGALLFGVSPTDPGTFAAVSATLVAVAVIASYLPARKATRIDPVEALRVD